MWKDNSPGVPVFSDPDGLAVVERSIVKRNVLAKVKPLFTQSDTHLFSLISIKANQKSQSDKQGYFSLCR